MNKKSNIVLRKQDLGWPESLTRGHLSHTSMLLLVKSPRPYGFYKDCSSVTRARNTLKRDLSGFEDLLTSAPYSPRICFHSSCDHIPKEKLGRKELTQFKVGSPSKGKAQLQEAAASGLMVWNLSSSSFSLGTQIKGEGTTHTQGGPP